MNINLARRCVLVSALILFAVALAFAQEKTPAATAGSDFERAEKARQTGDLDSAVQFYRKAIEAQPDNVAAHSMFAFTVYMQQLNKLRAAAAGQGGAKPAPEDAAAAADLERKARAVGTQELTQIYQKLIYDHPQVVAFRYQLVNVQHGEDGALESELKLLTERYPKFAPAYADLASIVMRRGDLELERSYYRKAMALQPDNAQYAYGYASTFEMRDPKEYRRLAEELAQRFPNTSWAAYALHFAAADAGSVQDRIALLERALSETAGADTEETAGADTEDELLNLYARRDVGKAAAVSGETLAMMRRNAKANKYSVTHAEQMADYYGSVARGRQLLADGKTAEAAAAIEKTKAPQSPHPDNSLTLLKADVLLAQGQTKNAYQYLLDQPATIADEELRSPAERIGKQIDRAPREVESDAWAACLQRARPVPDFSLDNFQGGKTKPADYHGRIVLINLWAPG
jgi:tetratricopeptide (TPR) repeat protein